MTPTLQKPRETVRAKLPHYLEPKEIEILIDYAANQSRMAANFMLTMWRAGLRVSEAVNLEARDLRFKTDRPQLHIRNAKGHKERFVPAHPELLRTLTEHCQYIRAKGRTLFSWSRDRARKRPDKQAMVGSLGRWPRP